MKNEKIDNLFKNKLAQHEVAPRADAWAKLEDKMATKKPSYLVYWRVAAVLILLITSVFVLYDFNGDDTTVATTEEVTPKENEVKDVEDKIINNDSETQLADTEDIVKEKAATEDDVSTQIIKRKITPIAAQQQTKKQRVIDITAPKEQQELVADNSVEKEADLIKEDALNLIDKVENDKAVAVTEDIQDTPNKSYDFGPKVVITFKKDKVAGKQAIASVKDDKNKKRKLLRKVLNFAKEVKSKNIGLASIREAKDEILTFNSKKNSQKTNPK